MPINTDSAADPGRLFEIQDGDGTRVVYVDPAPAERGLPDWVKVSFDDLDRAGDGTFLMPRSIFAAVAIREIGRHQ